MGPVRLFVHSQANAAIKRYHREFYRPDNLLVVVTGGVDCDELLKSLARRLINRPACAQF